MTDQTGTQEESLEEARAGKPGDDVKSPFVDLSGLALDDIVRLPDNALGAALRAIMKSAEDPDGAFTAAHKESQSRS
ncbi:hypothetical protein [Streptomyces sp. NBC_01477]|uniref:hypothetical protein n=1 Tax=Streptomyces sp. NBC_01477 TaxID=2976015 RepID=UPI002E31F631|nr:hypothetical protein [Streptomyces sp. NBC_01477]